jgi:cellulose synthase A
MSGGGGGGKRIHPLPFADPNLPGALLTLFAVGICQCECHNVYPCADDRLAGAAVQPRSMDPSKDLAAYGYGSVAWKERMEGWKQKQERLQHVRSEGGGDWDGDDADLPLYVLCSSALVDL